MELIRKWLSGKRNYIIGAVLYKQFGRDEKLKKLFAGKPDAYLQKRLAEELTALANGTTKPAAPAAVKKGDADEMPKSNDAVLEAIRNEWVPLFQRMNYLRHELDRVGNNSYPLYDLDQPDNSPESIAKRKPMALEILELEQQCMRLWARRDHYLASGKLPEVKTDEEDLPESPVELLKAEAAADRNVRRNKKLARENPANTVYPLKVQYYEKLLERIRQKIKDEGTKK